MHEHDHRDDQHGHREHDHGHEHLHPGENEPDHEHPHRAESGHEHPLRGENPHRGDDRGRDPEHGHRHDPMDHAGLFADRPAPLTRDYAARAFTVGIGGPVGSGKTALLLALCRALRDRHSLGVVTNDIFTREDAEFLVRHQALPIERIRAVETGGCPHAAIREDISHNLLALEQLMRSTAASWPTTPSTSSMSPEGTKCRARVAPESPSPICW